MDAAGAQTADTALWLIASPVASFENVREVSIAAT
jgi:hypothetical protein